MLHGEHNSLPGLHQALVQAGMPAFCLVVCWSTLDMLVRSVQLHCVTAVETPLADRGRLAG